MTFFNKYIIYKILRKKDILCTKYYNAKINKSKKSRK